MLATTRRHNRLYRGGVLLTDKRRAQWTDSGHTYILRDLHSKSRFRDSTGVYSAQCQTAEVDRWSLLSAAVASAASTSASVETSAEAETVVEMEVDSSPHPSLTDANQSINQSIDQSINDIMTINVAYKKALNSSHAPPWNHTDTQTDRHTHRQRSKAVTLLI